MYMQLQGNESPAQNKSEAIKGLPKHDYKKKNCVPQLNKRQNSIKVARKLTAGEKIRNMAHKTDKHWQTITS